MSGAPVVRQQQANIGDAREAGRGQVDSRKPLGLSRGLQQCAPRGAFVANGNVATALDAVMERTDNVLFRPGMKQLRPRATGPNLR